MPLLPTPPRPPAPALPRQSNYRPRATRLLGVIDGYFLRRSPGHSFSHFFLAARYYPPSRNLRRRATPLAQRLTPKSLASRLYRGTGNKSRPVFASLRRKVERHSWLVCFTAPVARRSVGFVATRCAWAMRTGVLGGTSSAATGRNQVDTGLSRAVAGCDGARQAEDA